MADRKKKLSSIKESAFSRGFALARTSLSLGSKAASHAMGALLAPAEEREGRAKELLRAQAEILVNELGKLKGSVMKIGQSISVVGEYFLPPEANAVLKRLQSDSPPLEWPAIERVLKRQLPAERLAELDIEREPVASASLGQVHRARRLSDGAVISLKIQYPGVDQSIESDLKTVKRLLSITKFLPVNVDQEAMFAEVRSMLKQEVDYTKELENHLEFKRKIGNDPRYVVPDVFPEYCSKRVFATRFEDGVKVDSPEVKALSQDRRNRLGIAFLENYFHEFFEWHMVQTDAHFGNYRVRLDPNGGADQLILYDFGAIRRFNDAFYQPYLRMIRGAFLKDRRLLEDAAYEIGLLEREDPSGLKDVFGSLCFLFLEPFENDEEYDWGSSDLPKRVAKMGTEMVLKFRVRTPPREVVFLDRKMSGVFIFLSSLGVKINAHPILKKYLSPQPS